MKVGPQGKCGMYICLWGIFTAPNRPKHFPRLSTVFSDSASENHPRPGFTRREPLTLRQLNGFEHTHVWDVTRSSRVGCEQSNTEPCMVQQQKCVRSLRMKSYGRKQEVKASGFSCRMTPSTDTRKSHMIVSNIIGVCAHHRSRQNRRGLAAPSGNQKYPKGRCLGLLSDGRERWWWWTEV